MNDLILYHINIVVNKFDVYFTSIDIQNTYYSTIILNTSNTKVNISDTDGVILVSNLKRYIRRTLKIFGIDGDKYYTYFNYNR